MTAQPAARHVTLLGTVCCALGLVPPAAAQIVATVSEGAAPQRPFAFALSLAGGVDRVGGGLAADATPRRAGEGRHSQVQASWLYSRPSRSRTLTISGHSAVRYFPDVANSRVGSYGLAVAGSWTAGRRTTFDASHSVSYAPLSLFGAVENLAMPTADGPSIDEGLFTRMTLRHGGAVRLGRVLDRRTSAAFGFDYTAADARDGDAVGSRLAYARLRRSVSPRVTVRLGYGAGSAQFGSGQARAVHHNLDIGLDYSPLSPRTTLTFRTGSVVLTGATKAYRLDVSAAARHPLGRDWRLQVTYDRPMEFVEGFAEPLLSDALTAAVDGRLLRRVGISAAFSISDGAVGAGLPGRRFRSHGASTRFQVPLGRQWMLTAEYADFQYRFADSIALPGRVPRELRRRTMRSGLTWTFGSLWRTS